MPPAFTPHEHALILALVRRRVWRLGPLFGESAIDRDDVAQEWLLQVYIRLAHYDATRGTLEAFVTAILRSIVANWWRSLETKKRRPPRQRVPLTVMDQRAAGRSQPTTASAVATSDAQHDLADFFQRLPIEQQRLLAALVEPSYRAAARHLGLPFSTFMGRLRQLRAVMKTADLHEYLAQ